MLIGPTANVNLNKSNKNVKSADRADRREDSDQLQRMSSVFVSWVL